ncbi:MAG: peptidyl-prolyl cis-trans isomerase [Acidobacteriota bacterium]
MSWIKSPALHMAVLGGLMFGITVQRGGALFDARRIEVPSHRFELSLQGFVSDNFRLPTLDEQQEILDNLIDQEVLYTYALELGMHDQPAAQRRLAQIAEFVESNPHEHPTQAELAEEAMTLGLHHGDMVVRRILIDSATRLIRAVVLVQDPRPELVEAYLASHPERFEQPARSRISQVMANGFKWPDTGARAGELLAHIRSESLSLEAAVALGDEGFVEPHLEPLTEKALTTKFGSELAASVLQLPVGAWSEPIESRYGHHLIYVHELLPAYVPPLAEVYDEVAAELLRKLADDWLALRLEELRAEYEIIAPEITAPDITAQVPTTEAAS